MRVLSRDSIKTYSNVLGETGCNSAGDPSKTLRSICADPRPTKARTVRCEASVGIVAATRCKVMTWQLTKRMAADAARWKFNNHDSSRQQQVLRLTADVHRLTCYVGRARQGGIEASTTRAKYGW